MKSPDEKKRFLLYSYSLLSPIYFDFDFHVMMQTIIVTQESPKKYCSTTTNDVDDVDCK